MNGRTGLVVAVAAAGLTQLLLLPAAAQTTFTNPTPITIPVLGPFTPAPWPGSPYPSNIAVSGLSGAVTDVNVTLHGFDCSDRGPDFAYPEDIDILLVGPTGANVVVLSDVGGANQPTALQFTNITVTLDDEAASPLPADTQLTSGTYRPLDDDDDPGEQVAVDTFPAPAPAPSAATALSVFDGTNPNGTWSLYVVDDYAGPNNCSILRGWSLDISTTVGTTTTTVPTTTTTTTVPPTTTTVPPTTTTVPPTVPMCDGLSATIVGTEGDDTIKGTNERDVIVGLGGNDRIIGRGGDDVICGGPGDDFIAGNEGNDRLFGQGGDDHITGGGGVDLHDGGPGDDLCAGGANDSYNDCEKGFPATLVSATHDGAGDRAARLAGASVVVLWVVTSWRPGRLRRKSSLDGPKAAR